MGLRLTLKDLNRTNLTEFIKAYWNDPITTYEDRRREKEIEQFAPAARERGYLEKDEFMTFVKWKLESGRFGCGHIEKAERNSTEQIEGVTQRAFARKDRQEAIDDMRELHQVEFATATAIRKRTPQP